MSETIAIRIRYRLGASDVVRALECHRRRPGVLNMVGWGVTVAALAVLLRRQDGPAWLVATLFVVAVVLAAAAVAWPTVDAWWLHRRGRIFSPTELNVSGDGMEIQVGATRRRLLWSAIVRYAILPQLFMLYWSESEFVMVPKRAFSSAAELHAFEASLREHLGPPWPECDRKES